jgi:hypothetical protein
VFPLLRLRLQAFRIRILDRTIRRLSQRHRVYAGLAGILVARMAAERVLWRGTVRPGERVTISMRRPGTSADSGPG